MEVNGSRVLVAGATGARAVAMAVAGELSACSTSVAVAAHAREVWRSLWPGTVAVTSPRLGVVEVCGHGPDGLGTGLGLGALFTDTD